MTDTDTLRAALERIVEECNNARTDSSRHVALHAIRSDAQAALATLSKPEPAAEPVAWMYCSSKNVHCFAERAEDTSIFKRQRGWTETPLYASPVPSGGAGKFLKSIKAEADRANEVIRLNRHREGQGMITVATAMHRIADWVWRAMSGQSSEAISPPDARAVVEAQKAAEAWKINKDPADAQFCAKQLVNLLAALQSGASK